MWGAERPALGSRKPAYTQDTEILDIPGLVTGSAVQTEITREGEETPRLIKFSVNRGVTLGAEMVAYRSLSCMLSWH